jgi:hypothetical protein
VTNAVTMILMPFMQILLCYSPSVAPIMEVE